MAPGRECSNTDLRPPRDCSLPAHPLSDRELAELIGRAVEKKWQLYLDREGDFWRRTTAGWVRLQGPGDESAVELDAGPEAL